MTAFWRRRKRRGESDEAAMGGIDCEAAFERLYEYLDEELDDPELVRKIREHLQICQRCEPRFQFEEAFLKFVSEVGRTTAPPGLRRKIFQRILEEGGETDNAAAKSE